MYNTRGKHVRHARLTNVHQASTEPRAGTRMPDLPERSIDKIEHTTSSCSLYMGP